ncbi:MAG: hypothetical protein HGA45_11045 [Chloroflexales bacterium]|nr:hypothetical protein [Chloroflexales bacterium]
MQLPTPLTDLRRRAPLARQCITDALADLVGPAELSYEFYRECNGCWKVRVAVSGPVSDRLEFTLLDTPGGGMLALPGSMPEHWRREIGIRASDGTRWTLDTTGNLVLFTRP